MGNLLKEAALVETTSEALRMIKQNAVKRDGEVVADGKLLVTAGTAVWQVGKRKFACITVALNKQLVFILIPPLCGIFFICHNEIKMR